jgi:succinylarginine dihydrolase
VVSTVTFVVPDARKDVEMIRPLGCSGKEIDMLTDRACTLKTAGAAKPVGAASSVTNEAAALVVEPPVVLATKL